MRVASVIAIFLCPNSSFTNKSTLAITKRLAKVRRVMEREILKTTCWTARSNAVQNYGMCLAVSERQHRL
jgi:hypothetical protein